MPVRLPLTLLYLFAGVDVYCGSMPKHPSSQGGLVGLSLETPIWERLFTVAPLVIVGTRERDAFDFAPKHLAMPMGWSNRFGFVCTPRHHTYKNVVRDETFTVSFPRPSSVVATSLTASPRCDDGTKPLLDQLSTFESPGGHGKYVTDGYLHLACTLERVIDDFDENSLIVGRVVEALAAPGALRKSEVEDASVIASEPLLAYLHPGYYAAVKQARAFPFSRGFRR